MYSTPSTPRRLSITDGDEHECSVPAATATSSTGGGSTTDECVKRVSLDATETWMTDDDDEHCFTEDWTGGAFLDALNKDPLLDTTVSLADMTVDSFLSSPLDMMLNGDDKDDILWSSLLEDHKPPAVSTTTNSSTTGTAAADSASSSASSSSSGMDALWEERRKQLAASMVRSQKSRAWISSHIQRRATLKRILQDISASTREVATLLQHQQQLAAAAAADLAATTDSVGVEQEPPQEEDDEHHDDSSQQQRKKQAI